MCVGQVCSFSACEVTHLCYTEQNFCAVQLGEGETVFLVDLVSSTILNHLHTLSEKLFMHIDFVDITRKVSFYFVRRQFLRCIRKLRLFFISN